MNLELLQNHIDGFIDGIVVPKMASDGSNAGDFFVADVVGNKKFVQNFGGYPRSEIAELNEAVSLQMQKEILNSLVDYSSSSNPTAGMTDAEIMLGHKSRYQQAPTEMQDWLNDQLIIRDAKRAQAYEEMRKAASARVIQSQSDKSIVIEPE